ncbi:type 1 glutamine amidotransferase [Lentibacillus persicus]|nr:gamma-glutamyl-gamma-aminobutyrate hydrolase family protein [Lentibacillus persicus]
MQKLLIINNEKDRDDIGWIPQIKKAVSAVENVEFAVIHHSEASKDTLDDINPDLIYLTGRATYDWTIDEILKDYTSIINMLQYTEIPTLGVCAGHELMAIAYGGSFGKMIETEKGKEDVREKGFHKIDVTKETPLFKGLGSHFHCYQDHRDEVKNVPDTFELLASNDMCKIQSIKHREKEFYGVQFHPEQYTEDYPDGKIILQNFLTLK